MRASHPDAEGYVERDGVRVFWERYGEGDPAVLFMAPWSIVHSRCWKAQLPYFGRHGCAIAFDPRGNGRSDSPTDVAAYDEREYAVDALAVLDAVGVERAVVVSLSRGARWALLLVGEHPDRVAGACFIAPSLPLVAPPGGRAAAIAAFENERTSYDGWWKYNLHHWRHDHADFAEHFFTLAYNEPHSTKQLEDCVEWARQADPEALIASELGLRIRTREEVARLCAGVRCPSLVIHGDRDAVFGVDCGRALADCTSGELVVLEGSGHMAQARVPVRVNLLLREFVESLGSNG